MIRKRSEVQGTQPASAGTTTPQDASPTAPAPKAERAPDRAAPTSTQAPTTSSATTADPGPAPTPRQTSQQPKDLVFAGDEVTMCYGIDRYSPVDYNSFEHGPFFVKVKVREGETVEDAGARAWNACTELARGSYPGKSQEYLRNLFALGAEIEKLKSHLK